MFEGRLKMKNLKKYRKDDRDTETHVTSVNITKKQRDFIAKNRLNLSLILRDLLEDLIRQHEKTELEEFRKAE